MRERCTRPAHQAYPHYGGRGITVCERWLNSFENFLADMGERPAGKTLDRFPNVNGNYEPGNCRWATPVQQSQNRASNKLEPHEADQIRWLASDGIDLKDIARFFSIGMTSVYRITAIDCETRRNTKLTPIEVQAIRGRRPGETYKVLAQRYGVSPSTIKQVLSGRTWNGI